MRNALASDTLARSAPEITVSDIVSAVDEPMDTTHCGGLENCDDDKRCMTHELWTSLNKHMQEYLAAISLQDLVAKHLANTATLVVDERIRMRRRRDDVALSA